MLYSIYSNPMDLVDRYIKQRRFGEFVQGFMKAEHERKKQVMDVVNECLTQIAYIQVCVHGYYNGTYEEYKKSTIAPANTSGKKSTADMTENDIKALYIKLFGAPQPQE